MDDKRIAVCITDQAHWANKAVNLACGLAQDTQAELVLLKMIPIQHVSWLGMPLGDITLDPTPLSDYEYLAAKYPIQVSVCAFQYYTLADAIAEAAAHVQATTLFATLPQYTLNFWRKFQLWQLEKHLRQQGCHLYTLDEPLDNAVWLPPAHISSLK